MLNKGLHISKAWILFWRIIYLIIMVSKNHFCDFILSNILLKSVSFYSGNSILKINFWRVCPKNVCTYTNRLPKNDFEENFGSNFCGNLFSFLKFYVKGVTEIDFGIIAHVKVGVIAHIKKYRCFLWGKFRLRYSPRALCNTHTDSMKKSIELFKPLVVKL